MLNNIFQKATVATNVTTTIVFNISLVTKSLLFFQANVADLEKKLADKDSEKAELSRSFSQDFELELEKEKNRHEAELQKQVSFVQIVLLKLLVVLLGIVLSYCLCFILVLPFFQLLKKN